MQYVEYIQNGTGSSQSTGWSIPLNYHPSETNDVVMKVKSSHPGSPVDGNLTVGCFSGNGNFFRFFTYQNNRMLFDCPNDSNLRITLTCSPNVPTEWEMGAKPNGNYYFTNVTDNLTTTGTSSLQRVFQGDFYVFCDASTRNSTERQRIYYIEIYENGTKVKDYRPVIDSNNVVCLYEKVGGTYHYCGKTLIAGPTLSSIAAEASKTSLAASGETISIDVECENAWTVTGNTFLALSSTGGTGNTTITATAPNYTGATVRADILTFTDSVTGDEAEITIKQKKYRSPALGQPVYLGGDEITELYLGGDAVSEAYLGDVLVYSSGPFVGIKVLPKNITFNSVSLTSQVKVKSSENWTMTLPSWLSASQTSGDTGETVVSLTATTQTADISGSIVATTANYSASTEATFYKVDMGGYLHISGASNFVTDFNPYVEYSKNNYLRLELNFDINTNGYLIGGNLNNSWFSLERAGVNSYWNFGSTTGAITNVPNTSGYATTYTLTIANNRASDSNGAARNISGTLPNVSLPISSSGSPKSVSDFYEMKVYNSETNLVYDFVAAQIGSTPILFDLVNSKMYYGMEGTVEYVCNTECQCVNAGGSWDGSECTYPEDPCGGDPCCEQGISDPAECDCMMTGGWWDGSECHYD